MILIAKKDLDRFATKDDLRLLEKDIQKDIQGIDQRLSVIQWIGAIFLALNASIVSVFLWAVALKVL